jgi:hypothetical protein
MPRFSGASGNHQLRGGASGSPGGYWIARSSRAMTVTMKQLYFTMSYAAFGRQVLKWIDDSKNGHSTAIFADAVSTFPLSSVQWNSSVPLSVATVKNVMNGFAAIA